MSPLYLASTALLATGVSCASALAAVLTDWLCRQILSFQGGST